MHLKPLLWMGMRRILGPRQLRVNAIAITVIACVACAALSAFTVPTGGSCKENSDCQNIADTCTRGICGGNCLTNQDCPSTQLETVCAYPFDGSNECTGTVLATCVEPGWDTPNRDGGWSLEEDAAHPPPACGCNGAAVPWFTYGYLAAPVAGGSYPCTGGADAGKD